MKLRPPALLVIDKSQRLSGATEAREQTHPFEKRDAPLAVALRHIRPVLQNLGQLLTVHLDPLPFQLHQTAFAFQQIHQIIFVQRLAVQHNLHREIQHRMPEIALPIPHPHGHRWARRTSRFPPIGNTNNQATFFHGGDLIHECPGLRRRPRQRLKDAPRIDQLAHDLAALRRLLHRH